MKRLAILGAGGHGKVVSEAAILVGYDEIVFFDAVWAERKHHMGFEVVGDDFAIIGGKIAFDAAIIALGDNWLRAHWSAQFEQHGIVQTRVVHPSAVISRSAVIGQGTVVLAGAIVNASASVGDGCILNIASTVDHDCIIGNFAHIAPGANISGEVIIGAQCLIGVGAAVRPSMSIGVGVTVGAGSVVVRSIPDGQTVIGNPARVLDR